MLLQARQAIKRGLKCSSVTSIQALRLNTKDIYPCHVTY